MEKKYINSLKPVKKGPTGIHVLYLIMLQIYEISAFYLKQEPRKSPFPQFIDYGQMDRRTDRQTDGHCEL